MFWHKILHPDILHDKAYSGSAMQQCAGDDLMDAKPSLLALTPVVRSLPVPMQPVTW